MKKLFILALLAISLVFAPGVYAGNNDVATARGAIFSPYWQTDSTTGSYTFIAVSNPSIAGNLSRAVTVKAILASGSIAGLASTFTIPLGQTVKLFIVATNHSTVNSISDTASKFIGTTTSGGTHGHLIITAAYPYINDSPNNLYGGLNTSYIDILSTWGAIFDPTANTGFAIEFIGDMTDSTGESAGILGGVSQGNL